MRVGSFADTDCGSVPILPADRYLMRIAAGHDCGWRLAIADGFAQGWYLCCDRGWRLALADEFNCIRYLSAGSTCGYHNICRDRGWQLVTIADGVLHMQMSLIAAFSLLNFLVWTW